MLQCSQGGIIANDLSSKMVHSTLQKDAFALNGTLIFPHVSATALVVFSWSDPKNGNALYLRVPNLLTDTSALQLLSLNRYLTRAYLCDLILRRKDAQAFDMALNSQFVSLLRPFWVGTLWVTPSQLIQLRPAIQSGLIRTEGAIFCGGSLLGHEADAFFAMLLNAAGLGPWLSCSLEPETDLAVIFVDQLFQVGHCLT